MTKKKKKKKKKNRDELAVEMVSRSGILESRPGNKGTFTLFEEN